MSYFAIARGGVAPVSSLLALHQVLDVFSGLEEYIFSVSATSCNFVG